MDFGMILRTAFEILLIGFTFWALLHEDRFAAIEQRLFAHIRRRKLRVIEGNNCRHGNHPVRDNGVG